MKFYWQDKWPVLIARSILVALTGLMVVMNLINSGAHEGQYIRQLIPSAAAALLFALGRKLTFIQFAIGMAILIVFQPYMVY